MSATTNEQREPAEPGPADKKSPCQKAFLQEHALRRALEEHTLFSITDRSGKIIEVNTGFCRISGYSRDELLGQNHRILNSGVHPRSFWVDMWKTIAAGDPWRGEVCNRAKDGSLYWVDSINLPWLDDDGDIVGFISLRLDISEKKRGEQEVTRLLAELEEQRTLLNTVIESVSDGIIAESEDGEFLIFNKAAARILGKEVDGASPESWSQTHPLYELDGKTITPSDQLPLRRAQQGEKVVNLDLLVRQPELDVRISCNASSFVCGDQHGAVLTFRDVTERENMRNRLQQAQKLESIGQLAAGVAHEINTPLQCVTTNISFINRSQPEILTVVDALLGLLDAGQDLDERTAAVRELIEQRRFHRIVDQRNGAVEDIEVAVRRVSEIVQAMKNVSHPGSAKADFFDVNRVIRNAVTITSNRWKHAAELVEELDEGLAEVYGRHGEISQVAINLIVNAADALAEKVGTSGTLGKITVRTGQQPDGRFVLQVIDDGPGIEPEIASRIFDPFFTTKEVGKGTGQGLAICYDVIVNRHGGTIEVDSQPGEGATFTVRLPPPPRDEVAEEAAEERLEVPVGG